MEKFTKDPKISEIVSCIQDIREALRHAQTPWVTAAGKLIAARVSDASLRERLNLTTAFFHTKLTASYLPTVR